MSAEQARLAAEDARRHRDEVFFAAERLRREAEQLRASAEQGRRTSADRFETDTRQAIREELEISAEMQKSANTLGERGGARPGASRKTRRGKGRSGPR